VNEDGTPNAADAPAKPLSIASFQVNGAGRTDPPCVDGKLAADGEAKLMLPVTATIGGLESRIVGAGPVAGLVNGVVQISLEVPADAAPDPAAAVVVAVGTSPSPPVTMAIGPAE